MNQPQFHCTKCGLCCRLDLAPDLPPDWDRGDGFCKYLRQDMTCDIYETRPLVCRVDEHWDRDPDFVRDRTGVLTREQFHALLYEGCKRLQEDADGV
jgi:Fe-S-cluster containining protein